MRENGDVGQAAGDNAEARGSVDQAVSLRACWRATGVVHEECQRGEARSGRGHEVYDSRWRWWTRPRWFYDSIFLELLQSLAQSGQGRLDQGNIGNTLSARFEVPRLSYIIYPIVMILMIERESVFRGTIDRSGISR